MITLLQLHRRSGPDSPVYALQIEQLQAGKRSLDRVLEAKDLELQAAHSRVKEAMVRPCVPA